MAEAVDGKTAVALQRRSCPSITAYGHILHQSVSSRCCAPTHHALSAGAEVVLFSVSALYKEVCRHAVRVVLFLVDVGKDFPVVVVMMQPD